MNSGRAVKLFNDPVHGFLELPRGLLSELIEHRFIQRLRHIRQLGLGSLVYPGATHSRFSHALGALALMQQALQTLRNKGINITADEYEAVCAAILLHDIGHSPFSHALEKLLLPAVAHETITIELMHILNTQFNGKLDLAIAIFQGRYPRPFLHQLVSSQLDMDRIDYLMRDSFFTGVQEGIIGADRLIKTLMVADENLVIEEKGLYSVEKFIVARRLMYWQVYLHKTALAGEYLLRHIILRAKELVANGVCFSISPGLQNLLALAAPVDLSNDMLRRQYLADFVNTDDIDILAAVKNWQQSTDWVLSRLCKQLSSRKLFKAKIMPTPLPAEKLIYYQNVYAAIEGLTPEEARWFVFSGKLSNRAYFNASNHPIRILDKSGRLRDWEQVSDLGSLKGINTPVEKYFICMPLALREKLLSLKQTI
jgi:HD superfamily phosphohydrolase